MATRSFFAHFKNSAVRLLAIPLSGVVYFTSALPVHAQEEWSNECKYTTGNGFEVATFRGIECLIANILSVAMTFVGLAAFVMLLYGAFLYMTSGGSSKGADASKQALTYAVIGIIVGLMSFWILQLISSFTGVKGILEFNLSL